MGDTSSKEPACQSRRCKRCRFHPWFGKILWRRAWQPTLVFLSGKFHGQSSLVGLQSIGSQRVGHDWSDLVHKKWRMPSGLGHQAPVSWTTTWPLYITISWILLDFPRKMTNREIFLPILKMREAKSRGWEVGLHMLFMPLELMFLLHQKNSRWQAT